jgi:hypothetical protein
MGKNDYAMNPAAASRNRAASLEQDEAAGSAELRKMRLKSGDVVTVSLALSVSSRSAQGVLRFKHERITFRQPVGLIKKLPSRLEMLSDGWKRVRVQKIVEKCGWGSWVTQIGTITDTGAMHSGQAD